MRPLLFALFVPLLGAPSVVKAQEFPVQQVRDLRLKTIQRAIQCELGIFASQIRYRSLAQGRNQAGYSMTAQVRNTTGWGLDLGIFNWIKFGGHDTSSGGYDLAVTFRPKNIHPDNRQACSRRRDALVLADLRYCLSQVAEVSNETETWRCGSQINVKRDFSVSGTIPIYSVSFGPSASGGTEYSQGIKVALPPSALRAASQ